MLSGARLASDITTGLIQDPVHWGLRPTAGLWISSEIKSHLDDVPLSGVCRFKLSPAVAVPLEHSSPYKVQSKARNRLLRLMYLL